MRNWSFTRRLHWPRAIALQLLEPVGRRRVEILDAAREVGLLQLAQRRALEIGEARDAPQLEQRLGVGALERPDRHRQNSNALRD